MLSLATVLEDSARHYSDRVAIVEEGRRWTYGELDAAASRLARKLTALGLRAGDRVALTCPNGAAFAAAHFGIIKAGLVTVPLNILLTEREIAYHLDDSGARAYICHVDTPELPLAGTGSAGFTRAQACDHLVVLEADGSPSGESELPAAESGFPTRQTSETDTAVVLYTSGTTGQPKGAELTHSNLVQNALLAGRSYEISPQDVCFVALPLSHATGLSMLLHTAIAAGASLVMVPRYRPARALELMRDETVTVFLGVPTMYQTLLDATRSSLEHAGCADEAAKSLRLCLVGGAPAAPKLIEEFEGRFNIRLMDGYGLSETSPLVAANRPGLPPRAGSVGTAIWGVEVRIQIPGGGLAEAGAPGEVMVRGHNVMKGYLGRPDATRAAIDEDGWFHTGDIGQLDADGYLTILGRHKEMIIRGGFNVYPREIEEILLTHPAVAQAAVVGVPHRTHGEEIQAFVVRAPRATLTAQELIDWCRTAMAAYKYPRIIEFREHLPTNAVGKVSKADLLAQAPE
ncbi:MAG TPA: AMP-binding protein [Trebonia sp.]|nr:AMP-binding protein [Trebonia sp.]